MPKAVPWPDVARELEILLDQFSDTQVDIQSRGTYPVLQCVNTLNLL
jgi:hypothetical protein